LRIAQSLLLAKVIKFYSNSGEDYFNACLAEGGVCLCSIVFITLFHPTQTLVMQMGMRLRIACCTIMYKKVCIPSNILNNDPIKAIFLVIVF
jgi:ATP-binding cassette subfamily C (CFTR/MRP) protein 4